MQLVKLVGIALGQPTAVGAAVLTSAEYWRSQFGTKLIFTDLLLIKLEVTASKNPIRREDNEALEIINEFDAGQHLSAFYCVALSPWTNVEFNFLTFF